MKKSIYIVMVAVAAIALMVCTVRVGQSADMPAPVPNPELGRTERAYISRLLHESYDALPAEEKARWPDLSEALENLVYLHQDGQEMRRRGLLTDEMLNNCLHDANDHIRRYASRLLKRRSGATVVFKSGLVVVSS